MPVEWGSSFLAGNMTHQSANDREVQALLGRLVTAATDGFIQPGQRNHAISVDFMLDNLAHPASFVPGVKETTRIMDGYARLQPTTSSCISHLRNRLAEKFRFHGANKAAARLSALCPALRGLIRAKFSRTGRTNDAVRLHGRHAQGVRGV